MSTAEPTLPTRRVRSILVKVLIGLVALVAAILGYGFTLPDTFRVERSATIAAPVAVVFAQVNNFHKWEAWSPWAKLDPRAKNSFEGPEAGEGAVFRWDGNDEVGKGAMTITAVKPDERITLRLDFEKPMKDTSITDFVFEPEGDTTGVTWTMSGQHQNVFQKLICKVLNVEKMIGDKFEEGLVSLGRVTESR